MRLSADRSAGTENRKQIAEIVRHRIGSRRLQLISRKRCCHRDRVHSRRLGGTNARERILAHRAFFGRHSRIGGSLQKNIGSGLEIYNIRPGNDRGKIGNSFSYAPEVAFDLYPVGGECDRAGKAAEPSTA